MAQDGTQTNSTGAVSLGTRAEIFPSNPLPDLDMTGGSAYAARDKVGGGSDLMGIICNSGQPARLDALTSMRSADAPSILRLEDSGVVSWPPDGRRFFALAYQRPLAPRMKRTIDEQNTPLNDDAIHHNFIHPLIEALHVFQRVGLVHNAIRPTNIFWRIGSATPPQFGDCLAVPAGYGQPAVFETIERAMCQPSGRGIGTHHDDCYAFGMTLVFLLLGRNPFQGMDDAAVLDLKLDRGTFGAVTHNQRVSGNHTEILRGLLADDARQRWTATDLEQWRSGRRQTPKNTDAGRMASRFFEFKGKEYWQTRPMVGAMAANVADAAQLIEKGSLGKWLRRAMGDEDSAAHVEHAQNSLKASGKTAHFEEQLVARACIALDPPGPIRYRGLSVLPAGIADLLAEAVMNNGPTQAIAELIASQIVSFWVEMQRETRADLVPLAQQFERMRSIIERSSYGNGIERVLYEINLNLPCYSPMLRSQCVTAPKMLLAALERVAAAGGRPREPMDRHIAAFLIVRDRRGETLFDAMSTPETNPRHGLAILTLFADMQNRYGPDNLPMVAQWLLPLLDPAAQRFLGKNLREKLKSHMVEIAKQGNLAALARLLDDPERVERDRQEFMAARLLYLNTMKEIASIENKLANRDIVLRTTGKPMAASISTLLAIMLVLAAILRALWQAIGG